MSYPMQRSHPAYNTTMPLSMRRFRPTQSYVLPTMPGSRRSSFCDELAVAGENFRRLDAEHQREYQRRAGLCAHFNQHGCGLDATGSESGLCSACSYLCTYTKDDPRKPDTDKIFMTREEFANVDFTQACRAVFVNAEIVPTTPGPEPGLAEAVPADSAVAEAAVDQSAAHEQQARNQDKEMVDAPEAGPSRGPAPQQGPEQGLSELPQPGNADNEPVQRQPWESERAMLQSEEEMARDPDIIAYLEARKQDPVQSHPQPISFLAACARAEQKEILAQPGETAETEQQTGRYTRQHEQQHDKYREKYRERYHLVYEQHQRDMQEKKRIETAKQRQKQAAVDKMWRHRQRRQQEWQQKQEQVRQHENHDGEEGKGEAPEMAKQEHQQHTMTLPVRQPLPAATQGE